MHVYDPLRQKWLDHFDALRAEAKDLDRKSRLVQGRPRVTALNTGEVLSRAHDYVAVDAVEFEAWKEKCVALLNQIIAKDNPSYKLVKDLQRRYFPPSSSSLLRTLAARLSAIGDSFRAGLFDVSAQAGDEPAVSHVAQAGDSRQEKSGMVNLLRNAKTRAPKTKTRRKTPMRTEAAVLLESKRRCCLCFGFKGDALEKPGQVAHLDGDPSNNDKGNLAYLCLEHHDTYDTRTSQSKGLTIEEVRHYREKLYCHLGTHMMNSSQGRAMDPEPSILQMPGSAAGIRTANVSTNDGTIVLGDYHVNEKVVRQNVVKPGPEHISEAQALKIITLIKDLGRIDEDSGRRPSYSEWHTKLWNRFDVTSYKLIPKERGEEAEAWLLRQKAIQRRKLRRTDNPQWRKSLYTAIWARAKELGIEKQSVYDLAKDRLGLRQPISSLKELGERNLKKLHNIIFSLPRG